MTGRRTRGRPTGGESGAAYLFVLLALTALAGLGIALSRIGQTERQLGSSALAGLQAMNAAESGLAVAEARLVESEKTDALELTLVQSARGGLQVEHRASVEAIVPFTAAPCHLCEMGPTSPFRSVEFAVSASGERWLRDSSHPLDAGKLLGAFSLEATVTLQPWPLDERALADGPGGDS